MIIEGLHLCPDLARLPWAALGRGTALAALERGHTVAFCAEAEDGAGFAAALIDALDPEVALLLPRSDQARPALLERLEAAGRQVQALDTYRTMQADIEPIRGSGRRVAGHLTERRAAHGVARARCARQRLVHG